MLVANYRGHEIHLLENLDGSEKLFYAKKPESGFYPGGDKTVQGVKAQIDSFIAFYGSQEQEQEQEAPAEAQEPAEALERIDQIRTAVSASTGRSAWSRGVNDYAMELLEELEEAVRGGWQDMDVFSNKTILRKALLNGADSWSQYSWGGSSLIYNGDIAERLCCPSELKKTRNGERRPNTREEWLDTQARALGQACYRITEANRRIACTEEASND